MYLLRIQCYIFIPSFKFVEKNFEQRSRKSIVLLFHFHILHTPTRKSSFFSLSPLSTMLVKVSKLYKECIKSTKSRGLPLVRIPSKG